MRTPIASGLALLLSLGALPASSAVPFLHAPHHNPHGVASDGQSLWVADRSARRLSKVNPENGALLDEIDLNDTSGKPRPRGIAMVGSDLWFVTGDGVYSVDLDTRQVSMEFSGHGRFDPPQLELATSNLGLAFDGSHLWISTTAGRLYRVHPDTKVISRVFVIGEGVWGLSWHADHLWSLNGSTLQRHNPNSGAVEAAWPTYGGTMRGMAWLDGSFWIGERKTGSIQRFGITAPGNYNSQVWLVPGRLPLADPDAVMPNGVRVPQLPYACSHALHRGASHSEVRRILVSQHGKGSGAAHYYVAGMSAARRADETFAEHDLNGFVPEGGFRKYSDETLVVAPQFLNASDLDDHLPETIARWSGGKFWGALSAGDHSLDDPELQAGDLLRVSSFQALDLLLHHIASQCPNLAEIVIAGHSGGGQFAQRYAATSPFEDQIRSLRPNVSVRYVPMNAGSYLYMSAQRFDPDTLFLSEDHQNDFIQLIDPFIPASYASYLPDQSDHPPANYDDYGYGLSSASSLYSYLPSLGVIPERYRKRCVSILIGEDDDDPEHDSMPASNAAYMQGPTRLARAKIFHAHLRDHFGPDQIKSHSIAIVPGVGHNGTGTMLSEAGLATLFLHRCNGFEARIVEIAGWLTPPAKRLPRADLDGDGLSNLYEIAANLPPHIPNSSNDKPRIEIVSDGTAKFLALTYRRAIGQPETEMNVLISPDLQRWTTGGRVHSRKLIDRETEEVTVVSDAPLGATQQGFMQVEARWLGRGSPPIGGPQ